MSTRYPGGVITKTPVVPAGPYETGAAPGIWTLDQQLQAQKAGIWPLAGNLPPYIEDVFSTYLYTGTGANQTIINGVDLSTKGGLVWIKQRSSTGNHLLMTTNDGPTKRLRSNGDEAYVTSSAGRDFSSFNSNGFSLGVDEAASINTSSVTYASWSFREQAKFFDVVTWSGTGSNRTIAHNLGSVPGMIIVKRTDTNGAWQCYHRSLANTQYMVLNDTAAVATGATRWNSTTPTDTVFSLGTDATVNASGGTYVAYLFAHDAGGFGLTGTDNVISCGSFTTNGSGNATVSLGYEPQWLLSKWTTNADNWHIYDDLRGWSLNVNGTSSNANDLYPNSADAETNRTNNEWYKTSTGFAISGSGASRTYIYIAIRRGPMKVPTVGTSVFSPQALNAPANGTQVTTGFPVDLSMFKARDGGPSGQFQDRLRGLPSTAGTGTPALYPDATAAESTNQTGYEFWNTGYRTYTAQNAVWWLFRRAPGFFDEVCYTYTSGSVVISHNLGVTPELVILKRRDSAGNWFVYSQALGFSQRLGLNQTDAASAAAAISAATSTTFTTTFPGSGGATVVTYLFATLAGVSKVGSYTGTGTTQTINCGFTAGSRFVMIKRTDSTGDWYVWDSARGIVAGNDPYLFMNSAAAEVTGTDYVDTAASGFEISSTAPAAINANGGSFIFLAIA